MSAWKTISILTWAVFLCVFLSSCVHLQDSLETNEAHLVPEISHETSEKAEEGVVNNEKYKPFIESLKLQQINNDNQDVSSGSRWLSSSVTTIFPNATVTYTRPVFPFGSDKFEVTVGDKKYVFPGVYDAEEKKKYTAKLDNGQWEIFSAEKNPEIGQDTETHIYKGKRYINPDYIEGMGDSPDVYTVDGLIPNVSPRGIYFMYRMLTGGEVDALEIIEISTGKKIKNNFPGLLTQVQWIDDNQRMLFIWGFRESSLFVTKKWFFPEFEKISWNDRISAYYIDDNSLVALANLISKSDWECSDLIIYNRQTFKEVERITFTEPKKS